MNPRKFQLPNNLWTQAFLTAQRKTYTIRNEHLLEVTVDTDEDIYQLGYNIGKAQPKAKPEVFTISKADIAALKKAIQQFEEKNNRKLDNFSFAPDLTDPAELIQVTVQPAPGWVVYSIYTRCGQLLQLRESKKKK
jgi:hypothetical protein